MLKALFYRLSIVLKYTKNPLPSMLVYSGIKNKTICKLKNNLGEFEYCKDNKPVFGALLDSLEKIDKNDKNRLDEFKNFVMFVPRLPHDLKSFKSILLYKLVSVKNKFRL